MQPKRTERSNFMFRSQVHGVPDLPGERIKPGHIRSIWELNQRERDAVTEGLNIEVDVFGEPFPPLALNVTHEGATLLQRGNVLVADRYMTPDGHWYVRLLSVYGAELCVSREYKHRWSSWLARRCLKRILPTLETTPS